MGRALIFDYDGLMVDSEQMLAECIVDAVTEFGGTVTIQDFGHLFGSTEMDHEWERLLPLWCGRPVTLAELDEHITPRARALGDVLPLMPGVVELIEQARASGWKVGLGTGQSSRERLEARLRRNQVLDSFDAIVTVGEVQKGKPAPDIFLEVARRLDCEPSSCVVLEDSAHGCEAALVAGMQAVACPSPVTAHCVFPAGVRRIASLSELTLADL